MALPDQKNIFGRNALLSLIVSSIMVLLSCFLLFFSQYGQDRSEVFENSSFENAKSQLRSDPEDQQLQWAVRELDRRMINEYIFSRELADNSRYLLVVSFLALIVAARVYVFSRSELHTPDSADNCKCQHQRLRLYSSYAMLAFISVFALGTAGYLVNIFTASPETSAQPELTEASPAAQPEQQNYASIETLKQNWHRFRGFAGSGISPFNNIPLTFNLETGENIRWSVNTELDGFNSPVIFDDKIFYSGANELNRRVYCHSLIDGSLLWQASVDVSGRKSDDVPDVMEDTGFAAPTVATDGFYVYSIFANGDAACHDYQGKQMWAMNFGLPESTYGFSASLDVWKDSVLIQFDHGYDEVDSVSELISIQGSTGDIKWRVKRPVINSWTSPVLTETADKWQYITVSNPWTISYNPDNGNELWRFSPVNGDTAPSPVVAGNTAFVVSPYESVTAVNTALSGDISETGSLWQGEEGVPDTTSPITDGKNIWLLTSDGTLTCYNISDGQKLYDYSVGGFYYSSPSIVDGKMLFFDMEGKYSVVQPGTESEVVFETSFGEKVCSSPAFADGVMIVRTATKLYCISKN